MSRTHSQPLHEKISQHLRLQIEREGLAAGQALPTERALARQFRVNHLTVRRALHTLVAEGLIERHVGRGTFVADREASTPQAEAPAAGDTLATSPTQTPTVVLAMQEVLTASPSVGHALAGMREIFPQDDIAVELLAYPLRGFIDFCQRTRARRNLQGLIIQGWLQTREIEWLNAQRIPYVSSASYSADRHTLPGVSFDYDDLIKQAIHEAYRFGHTQFALLGWRHVDLPGYGHTCRQYNLLDSVPRRCGVLPPERPDPALIDLSSCWTQLEPATCIIVNDELLAAALMRDLEAAGRPIPQSASVISLQDFTPHMHRPPLTAPDSPRELQRVYRKVSHMLKMKMAGCEPRRFHLKHRSRLHFKSSLGPAPSDSMRSGATGDPSHQRGRHTTRIM